MAARAHQGVAGRPDRSTSCTRAFPGVSFGYLAKYRGQYRRGVVRASKGHQLGQGLWYRSRGRRTHRQRVEEVIDRVRGDGRHRVYRSLGQPNLLITPDRASCARYGLNVGDVNAVVQAAIGGQAITQVLEGDRSFRSDGAMASRNIAEPRRDPQHPRPDADRRVRPARCRSPTSGPSTGASFIYREGLERFVPVRFAVRGRDLQERRARRQAARGRAATQAARGRPSCMGGRIRRAPSGQSPPDDRYPARPAADHGHPVQRRPRSSTR